MEKYTISCAGSRFSTNTDAGYKKLCREREKMKNKYYNAVIAQQNETWQNMNQRAVFHFVNKLSEAPRARAAARKCAGVYTRCYNCIFSDNYDVALIDTCIPDAIECVRECSEYRKLKYSEHELALTAHLLYGDLFPDAETTIYDIKEYL